MMALVRRIAELRPMLKQAWPRLRHWIFERVRTAVATALERHPALDRIRDAGVRLGWPSR
ncbi:MAG: hypothetical protein SFX74_03115 [Fimbriimonadaceae bacterium]|nr:hypothetical protein [Fimbriimonadaceae bacterium]